MAHAIAINSGEIVAGAIVAGAAELLWRFDAGAPERISEMSEQYYQGDICFLKTNEEPRTPRSIKVWDGHALRFMAEREREAEGYYLIERGERTGHMHLAPTEQTAMPHMDTLIVYEETQVVHDEHPPLTLPPGEYEIRRQREYTPPAERSARGASLRSRVD